MSRVKKIRILLSNRHASNGPKQLDKEYCNNTPGEEHERLTDELSWIIEMDRNPTT
jgi:hypothetical protein